MRRSPEEIASYKVEPYVVAADVYARLAAHRPRRMDLVHGLGRLDVPADRGITPRTETGKHDIAFRSLPSAELDAFKVHYRTAKPCITSRCSNQIPGAPP